jgi:hypothetical protein
MDDRIHFVGQATVAAGEITRLSARPIVIEAQAS